MKEDANKEAVKVTAQEVIDILEDAMQQIETAANTLAGLLVDEPLESEDE